jgi:hypothetical protein
MLVHLVIEKTEDSTEVCGVYASIDKAILHAEDLADYADLVRGDSDLVGNFDYIWISRDGDGYLPIVYIESQGVIE